MLRRLPWFLPLLAACAPAPPEAPPAWWSGPGPAPADDDGTDDDDATPDGVLPGLDVAVVGVDDAAGLRLLGYQEDLGTLRAAPLSTVATPAVLQSVGERFLALSGGSSPQITVGSFDGGYSENSNPLPPGSDPVAFVNGLGCSVLVLGAGASALVIGEDPSAMPVFVDLRPYADADGDPEAASAVVVAERMFVGLRRLGPDGPDPAGGLAVELDCAGAILETQAIAPGGILSAPLVEASAGLVLAEGAAYAFDPAAPSWEGDVLWSGVQQVAIGTQGALWGVADGTLSCRTPPGEPGAVASGLGAVVALDVGTNGRACTLSEGGLRCWPARGCAVGDGLQATVDGVGRALAVVSLQAP